MPQAAQITAIAVYTEHKGAVTVGIVCIDPARANHVHGHFVTDEGVFFQTYRFTQITSMTWPRKGLILDVTQLELITRLFGRLAAEKVAGAIDARAESECFSFELTESQVALQAEIADELQARNGHR